jgi:1-pyrroline-5-carboxylate dehydrogenase
MLDTGLEWSNGAFSLPEIVNEPVRAYRPGSAERASVAATLRQMSGTEVDLPLYIGDRLVRTGKTFDVVMPHRHRHVLAHAHLADQQLTVDAIEAALGTARGWSSTPWQQRAAIFLKAADLLSGPWRDRLNAATMLGQSKTVHQAEIDSAAELIDFLRFNVRFMTQLYGEQPLSSGGAWNRVDYRPLEGFVYAITPFNFTAIAGNLPAAPALMGNVVLWKPAMTAMYSAHFVMELLRAAGLPDGVINLVQGEPAEITRAVLEHPALAGVHFTGSTEVFNQIQSQVAERLGAYRSYPRIVGETGGKNFVLAHRSADPAALTAAVIRGAFEYQGQKCSAASRLFVPRSLWARVKDQLCDELAQIKVGDVADFTNFMGAVIDGRAWERHAAAIARARKGEGGSLLAGGFADRSTGNFVGPTLIECPDLHSPFMTEELFGPIAAVCVFADERWDEMIDAIDGQTRYGLTGSVFATDRSAIVHASNRLRQAAGNFYINDKPTGAVVGQQPFGGARASGTNDKAGSIWNLMRWTSPRTIKETLVPVTDWRYPFLRG